MRDRTSVNSVAMATLKLLYPSLLDVGCFSHTLDRIGEQFKVPIAVEFTRLWISLFSRSPKARLAWRSYCGRAVPTHSETRWWSQWEVMKQILEAVGEIFVNNLDGDGPLTLQLMHRTGGKDIQRTYLTGAQLLSLYFWFNQVQQLLKGLFSPPKLFL